MSEIPEEAVPLDLRELYYEFGRAAETAQVMEIEAGNLALTYATVFVNISVITDEQREVFRALVDDLNKRTFGNLVREINKFRNISESMITIINDALEKRNYLMHSFFRKHNFAIFSEDGRRMMLAEIREIHASLGVAHAMLLAMTQSLDALLAEVTGSSRLSEADAKDLMSKGKRVNI